MGEEYTPTQTCCEGKVCGRFVQVGKFKIEHLLVLEPQHTATSKEQPGCEDQVVMMAVGKSAYHSESVTRIR
jgi:hypothetical protein